MTDKIKAKIEADTKKYKNQLKKFATERLAPVMHDIRA